MATATENLIDYLQERKPSTKDVPDEIHWNLEKTGTFTTRSMYRFINDGGIHARDVIWKVKVPLKIRAFNWLVSRDAVLTRDNLLKRKWQGPDECVFCSKHRKTFNHLFIHCSFAIQIWNAIKIAF